MNKFFEVIGYVASVAAAAFGIVWLVNKLIDARIEDEIEEELVEELGGEEETEAEAETVAEEAPAGEVADAEV